MVGLDSGNITLNTSSGRVRLGLSTKKSGFPRMYLKLKKISTTNYVKKTGVLRLVMGQVGSGSGNITQVWVGYQKSN